MIVATKTSRQQILDCLKEKEMSAYALAKALHSSEKLIEEHLLHLARSLGGQLRVVPAECKGCGFAFKKREKKSTPSKCPICRSHQIYPALFSVAA